MATYIKVLDFGFVNFDQVKYFDIRKIEGTNPDSYQLILSFEKDFTRIVTLGHYEQASNFQKNLREAGIKVVGNIR